MGSRGESGLRKGRFDFRQVPDGNVGVVAADGEAATIRMPRQKILVGVKEATIV